VAEHGGAEQYPGEQLSDYGGLLQPQHELGQQAAGSQHDGQLKQKIDEVVVLHGISVARAACSTGSRALK
jgi:hypothetical protein